MVWPPEANAMVHKEWGEVSVSPVIMEMNKTDRLQRETELWPQQITNHDTVQENKENTRERKAR